MSETTGSFIRVRDVRIHSRRGDLVVLPFQTGEFGDWLFVGTFDHDDIQADCNCRMLLATLLARSTRESFKHAVTYHAKTKLPLQSFVIVDSRIGSAVEVARECMDLHNEGEHISDEFYWQEVDVHLQRMWAEMSMPDRIDAVKRTNTPHHVILETEVSEEDHYDLWVHLYQDMGL